MKFHSDLVDMSKISHKFKRSSKIFGFASLFFGISLLMISALNIGHGLQSTNWMTTEGKVLSYWISPSILHFYELRVQYEYQVENKKCTSHNVSFTKKHGLTGDQMVSYAIKNYPVGSSVRVYFNPNKQDESVLEPGVHWHAFPILFLGFIFLVFWYRPKQDLRDQIHNQYNSRISNLKEKRSRSSYSLWTSASIPYLTVFMIIILFFLILINVS